MIKFLDELEKLKLERYVIIGSGALAIRGIRENNDLDVLVDEKTFEELKKKYSVNGKGAIVIGNIEVWDNFRPWFEAELLLGDCDMIEGFRYMKLEYLVSWKERCGRDKDLMDLKLIKEYLKKT